MVSNKWWKELTCTYNDNIHCTEICICELCEHFPKISNQSSQLDAKQLTIEDIINEKENRK